MRDEITFQKGNICNNKLDLFASQDDLHKVVRIVLLDELNCLLCSKP